MRNWSVNSSAARLGKRFLQSDLNRSCGLSSSADREQQRALQLESLFEDSHFLIDLHQTQSPAAEAFFISRFDPKSFRVAREVFPDLPVVTYLDRVRIARASRKYQRFPRRNFIGVKVDVLIDGIPCGSTEGGGRQMVGAH